MTPGTKAIGGIALCAVLIVGSLAVMARRHRANLPKSPTDVTDARARQGGDSPAGTRRLSPAASRNPGVPVPPGSASLHGIAGSAAFTAISNGLADRLAIEPETARWEALEAIGELLRTSEDVRFALAFLCEMTPSFDRNALLVGIVGRWADLEPHQAADWAAGIPSSSGRFSSIRTSALEAVMAAWCKSDAAAAADWILGYDNGGDVLDRQLLLSVMRNWAKSDGRMAAAWMSRIPDELDRQMGHTLEKALVTPWAQVDPGAATRWALTVSDERDSKRLLLRTALWIWVEKEPSAARAFMDTLPADARPTGIQAHLIASLSAESLDEALKLLEELHGVERQGALKKLVPAMCQNDPQAAYEFFEARREDGQVLDLAGSVVAALTMVDPDKAGLLVNSLPDSHKGQAAQTMLVQWAQDNPVAAVNWAVEHNDIAYSDWTLTTVGISWAKQDPAAAAQWAAVQEGPLQGKLLRQIVTVWAAADYPAAERFALSLPAGQARDETRDMAAKQNIRNLAGTDPPAAAALLSSADFTAGAALFIDVAGDWAGVDPAAAAQWVLKLPDDKRQPALAVVVQKWFAKNPRLAAEWAESITDPATRASATEAVRVLTRQIE